MLRLQIASFSFFFYEKILSIIMFYGGNFFIMVAIYIRFVICAVVPHKCRFRLKVCPFQP